MKLGKRLPLYLLGLLVMAFGIILTTKADLGTTPVSAFPYALSKVTPLSFGLQATLSHILFIVVQIVILRKVTLQIILQFPLAYVFGLLLDVFGLLLPITEPGLALSLLLMAAGIPLMALGITLIVIADLMLPPPDAMFRTISSHFGWKLSKVKVLGDIALVAIAAVVSLILAHDVFLAIGLGTVLCMLLTGRFIGLFLKVFSFLRPDASPVPEPEPALEPVPISVSEEESL
jgi:uncharacterized membrane protein YczE